MKRIFLLFCFVLFTITCFAQTNIDKLRWIEKANAVVDASKSIGEKDFRFMGIAGYAITFPGIPHEKQDELIRKFGYKIIEGTSDAVEGEEHIHLINLAQSYADAYNTAVLKHLAFDARSPHTQKLRYIEGSLPRGWIGGVPEAEIDKKTGRIIRISHGK